VGPVLVTVEAASTEKSAAVPSPTGVSCALASRAQLKINKVATTVAVAMTAAAN
jgi:hypothetical protein